MNKEENRKAEEQMAELNAGENAKEKEIPDEALDGAAGGSREPSGKKSARDSLA